MKPYPTQPDPNEDYFYSQSLGGHGHSHGGFEHSHEGHGHSHEGHGHSHGGAPCGGHSHGDHGHSHQTDKGTLAEVDLTGNTLSLPVPPGYEPSPRTHDIVKSTQYGLIDQVKEIIEDGYDVNQPDIENVTLLHWAAINNRLDIARYCKVFHLFWLWFVIKSFYEHCLNHLWPEGTKTKKVTAEENLNSSQNAWSFPMDAIAELFLCPYCFRYLWEEHPIQFTVCLVGFV